jgi:hypothetical protein
MTTTMMTGSVDDGAWSVRIPFTFTFLGTAYTSVGSRRPLLEALLSVNGEAIAHQAGP